MLVATLFFYMSSDTEKRQEVYDKIKKAGSKTKYIYAEMKRLGFWNEGEQNFAVIQKYFDKEAELVNELHALLVEKKKIEDPERLLKAIHEKRKEESRKKQAETKKKREELRLQKAARWEQIKKEEVIYLGDEYSNTLQNKESNVERLKTLSLPELNTAKDLADLMQVEVAELRFLSYSRKNSPINHYVRFTIPKRSGGERIISAPRPKLKRAQHWILENILNKVEVHEAAQGCVQGRSIKSNAEVHLRQEVVVNQDLKDFFPTISYARIRGLFKSLGYSGQLSSILALICSEPRITEVEAFGEKYFAQRGERFLPQGSPCSPAISNIICRNLDKRLSGLAKKFQFNYSRYVDDISFSASSDGVKNLNKILLYSRQIIRDEGFVLNPDKLRIMRKGRRQHVTGILVNEKPNVDKKTLKKFRALVYQVEKDGLEGKSWKGNGDLLSSMHGYASFIHQINPELGAPYKARVEAILKKHRYVPKNPYKKEKSKVEGKKATSNQNQNEPTSFFDKLKKLFGG